MRLREKPFGGRGAIGALDGKVVDRREHRLLARTQAVMAMLIQREEPVASLDTGTAALEQVGALTGDLFEVTAGFTVKGLDGVRRLLKRCEALRAQTLEPMPLLRVGAALGRPLQVERGNQVVEHRLLDHGSQVKGMHPGRDRHEEERQRGHQRGGESLRLGQMRAETLGQGRLFGDRLQALEERPEPLGEVLGGLRLAVLEVVGVIERAQVCDQHLGLGAACLDPLACQAGLDVVTQGAIDACGKRRRTSWTMGMAMVLLLGDARGLPARLGLGLFGLRLLLRARQRQARGLADLMLQMKEIGGMMGAEIALDMRQQPLGFIAGALHDGDVQPFEPTRERLRPGRRRALLGDLLDQDQARDGIDGHQAHPILPGLVFGDAQGTRRHGGGQLSALLVRAGDDVLLQVRMERLLRAIRGRDEVRQTAKLEELIDHADTTAANLGDAPVRGHQDPAQPLHALGRLAEGEQGRRGTARLGRVPVTQRTAGHTGAGRRGALTLSVMLRLRHRAETFGAMTSVMQWRRMSWCSRVNRGRGIGQRRFPRSVSTSKGTPPRRSCHAFIGINRLPRYSVLDQSMIKAGKC